MRKRGFHLIPKTSFRSMNPKVIIITTFNIDDLHARLHTFNTCHFTFYLYKTDHKVLPEIICTVKPALLPARLPFSSANASSNPTTTTPGTTEIRAFISNVTFSTGNVTFTRTFPTGNEHSTPEGVLIETTESGVRIILPNFKNTTGIYKLTVEDDSGREISASVVLHAADGKDFYSVFDF